MPPRDVIHIDPELCDGCGLCVEACSEGAVALVDGKARLVHAEHCDGLGACIGVCPAGALHVVHVPAPPETDAQEQACACGTDAPCPGSQPRLLAPTGAIPTGAIPTGAIPTGAIPTGAIPTGAKSGPRALCNWPVQLALAPVESKAWSQGGILLAADCVAFAAPDVYRLLLSGRALLIGCPKLDDASFYLDKLVAIFRSNQPALVDVAVMEVPCCRGFERIVREAAFRAGLNLDGTLTIVGIDGEVRKRSSFSSDG
jgi:NAD-dependent dihydropyrimidine dehydrogenase PreA subunit